MRSRFARFIRWLVSQSPFLGAPHDVTVERPETVRTRQQQELDAYRAMMQRSRDRLTDDFDRMR